MKNEKEKNLFLKIVLIVIIVGIIVFIIMNIVKSKKSKEGVGQNQNGESQQVEENAVKEEFVQQTDDGMKVNVGSKITDDKEVNGLKFTNVQLTEKDNQSTLLADVENATGKELKDYTNLDITFLTKDGQEIVTIKGILTPLKSGEKTQLNAGLTQDVANAYDIKIKVE
jgi:regulatory protein YycI of two-component signal transduction system YycFG